MKFSHSAAIVVSIYGLFALGGCAQNLSNQCPETATGTTTLTSAQEQAPLYLPAIDTTTDPWAPSPALPLDTSDPWDNSQSAAPTPPPLEGTPAERYPSQER
jgi:hypothetical protein